MLPVDPLPHARSLSSHDFPCMKANPIAPATILRDAIKAVPAVKYALGVAGIVSAVALISAFGLDLRIAGFATIIMILLMVLLVIFAKLTTTASHHFLRPVLILMWCALVLTLGSATLLFTSVFFRWPVPLQHWLGATVGVERTQRGSHAPIDVPHTKEKRDFEQLRREMLHVATEQHQRLLAEYDAGYAVFGITDNLLIVPYDTAVARPRIDWANSRVRASADSLSIYIPGSK